MDLSLAILAEGQAGLNRWFKASMAACGGTWYPYNSEGLQNLSKGGKG